MATDTFRTNMFAINHPLSAAFAITPNDTSELSYVTRCIWVGGAGNLKVLMTNGNELTFTGITAGSLLPFRVRKVFATGTTATGIIGMY